MAMSIVNCFILLSNNAENIYYHKLILRTVEFAGENLVHYVNESAFGEETIVLFIIVVVTMINM